jgi:hypothetical protein
MRTGVAIQTSNYDWDNVVGSRNKQAEQFLILHKSELYGSFIVTFKNLPSHSNYQ